MNTKTLGGIVYSHGLEVSPHRGLTTYKGGNEGIWGHLLTGAITEWPHWATRCTPPGMMQKETHNLTHVVFLPKTFPQKKSRENNQTNAEYDTFYKPTVLVSLKGWGNYSILNETKDIAIQYNAWSLIGSQIEKKIVIQRHLEGNWIQMTHQN